MSNLASPLFILREICAKDLFAALEKLAGIGYDGIEFLGFFGHRPKAIRAKLDALNLRAVGNHVAFHEFAAAPQKIIDDHLVLGCPFITIAAPGCEGMPDGPEYSQTLRTLEGIGALMRSVGMRLLFHNHASEPKRASNGRSVLENILDDTSPDALFLEPDLGWIKIGGGDPAHYLRKYVGRCPVIHFKDFYSDDLEKTAALPRHDLLPGNAEGGHFEFRPTGYGIMNNAALYRLAQKCAPEWYVMDHDAAYERDPFSDLKLSLDYFRNLQRL